VAQFAALIVFKSQSISPHVLLLTLAKSSGKSQPETLFVGRLIYSLPDFAIVVYFSQFFS